MLSVIVPVYNVAEYLPRCLDSLAGQTLDEIEFIIVNDGSTDGSDEICEQFIKDKKKFQIINKNNGGLMSAWIKGLERVRGDYLGFVDSDDYIDKDMFKEMYYAAMTFNSDIVMCNIANVNNEVVTVRQNVISEGFYSDEDLKWIRHLVFPRLKGLHITNARWNKIYKTDIYRKNLKYCELQSRLFEDRFIVPACMFSAKRFYYINKPLYFYRQRDQSNRSKPSPHLYEALKHLHDMQESMLIDNKLYDEYKDDLEVANINYIQMLMYRNLTNRSSFRNKLDTIFQVITDKDYASYMRKHKSELGGKIGFFLRLCFAIRVPIIILLIYECASSISRVLYTRSK